MQDDPETEFASLLASRLCHDLINPAGALSTALDILQNESDAEMRQHADSLLKESTDRLLAIIEFARLAYGASGGVEGDVDSEAVRGLAVRLYTHLKPELQWSLPQKALPKRQGRILMNLLLTAERMAPRANSTVTVSDSAVGFRMIAEGPKAKMPGDVAAALSGSAESQEPKLMPARLAYKLARSEGLEIVAHEADEHVTITLK